MTIILKYNLKGVYDILLNIRTAWIVYNKSILFMSYIYILDFKFPLSIPNLLNMLEDPNIVKFESL